MMLAIAWRSDLALRLVMEPMADSERKRESSIATQSALKLSEEKFRKAFYLTPDSMNINRLEDGLFVSINPGFTQIMGYDESDVRGKTSVDLNIWVNPGDSVQLVECLRRQC